MIIKQGILSFLATVGFATFYSTPHRAIMPTGLIGMTGWIAYFSCVNFLGFSKFISSFIASLCVNVISEFSAKMFKKPATLFIVPGLLPLVPGAGVYYTMFDFVNKNIPGAVEKGLETLLIAGALALGIIVASVFSNSIRQKNY